MLVGDSGEAEFLLQNANTEAVALSVFHHLKTRKAAGIHWQNMPVKVLPRILELVMEEHCTHCLYPLFEWQVTQSLEDLKEAMAQFRMSETSVSQLAAASGELVNTSKLSPYDAARLLASIAGSPGFNEMKALVSPMPHSLSTQFMIVLGELVPNNPGHFGKAVSAMSMLQAGHYLAALTRSEKLWQVHSVDAYLVTQKLTPEVHFVARFEPEETRFQLIKEWSKTLSESAEFIRKEDLKEDLSCSICTNVFFNPVTHQCGNTFCKACIDQWVQQNPLCPLCNLNIPAGGGGFTPNIILDNLITNRRLRSD